MNRIWKQIVRHKTALIIGGIRAFVYIGMFLLFFGLMSINNWQLTNLSRTLAITLVTYVAMSAVMHSVYGGFDVGRKKSKPVISSMILSVLCVDLITYLELQIMNVNVANHATLELFGADFPYLLLCMVLQCALIILCVRIGNHVYFYFTPPRKCLLIYNDQNDQQALLWKIGRYRLQWQVNHMIAYDDPDVDIYLRKAEVVFLGTLPAHAQMRLLHQCYDLRLDVICKAQLEDIMLSSSRQIIVDDAPFLAMEFNKITLSQRVIKRLMDIAVSAAVLLLFSPFYLLIAVCIKAEDKGPVIFKQERMSLNGKTFSIYKFRTMSVQASSQTTHTSASADDDRITRTGRWLRRFRLDEIPQFLNILKGDMTLVGPRPEMLDNIARYKRDLPAFAYREKVKAGLTGYAQIEGRYNTTPEDKVMLDLMYIESFSIRQDIKLLFRTLTIFFKSSDSTQGFAPAPPASQDDHHHGISANG